MRGSLQQLIELKLHLILVENVGQTKEVTTKKRLILFIFNNGSVGFNLSTSWMVDRSY